MSNWPPCALPGIKPAFVELADLIGNAIASGELAPYARLPAVRDLAATLGLASATVLRAYARASERGLIQGVVGRGTFVAPQSGENHVAREMFGARGYSAPGVYDLRSNVVPAPAEWSAGEARQALLPSARQREAILASAYLVGQSSEPTEVREAGALWAQGCGLGLSPGDVMLAAGGQHGIAAALCALGGAGASIAVPEVTNSGMLMAARTLGARLVPVRVDSSGLDPDHLEHVARARRPVALYCAPAGDNPIPVSLAQERRAAIGDLAQRFGFWIIEDDAPGLLVERRIAPLSQQAPDRTLWLASVAQSLGFGFRLAFVRVPAEVEKQMQAALRTLAWTGTTPGAMLAAQLFADGSVEKVIAGRRLAIDERHRLAREILGPERCVILPGIPYFWFATPPGWRTEALAEALFGEGVAVAPAGQFAADHKRPRRGVRIGGGGPLSIEEYEMALRRISAVCVHPGRYRRKREDSEPRD